MQGVLTELILRECVEKAQGESSLAKPNINKNVKIGLSKKYLMELRNNAYSGSEEEEDVVDHIAKVIEIIYSIKTPDMDTDRLRVHVFPFSLTGAAREWWINEGNDKILPKVKGEGNNELMDDIELSDEELKESNYENSCNNDTDSFFKPYLDAQEKDNIYEIEKESERNQNYQGGNIRRMNNIILNNSPYSQ
ncbi:hypothetical protein Tco_1156466 [Tanacetum coccineum]